MRKKAFICVFVAILFAPMVLGIVASRSALQCDVPLNGHIDLVSRPELSWNSVWNGEYQSQYGAWLDQNMKPRGVLTKTYATVRYNLFNMGNDPIGPNHDIFGIRYINGELVIDNIPDMSEESNRFVMEEYVAKLERLQEKLRKYGKILYISVTPSKADFDYDNIPKKYKDIADPSAVKPVDYFEELLSKTDIPHFFCRDMADELEYPAFYTTGVHWSRTFEQKVSARIIDELVKQTGKNYRRIIIGNVHQSNRPYWRDADVYATQNVWNRIKGITYYEYDTFADESQKIFDRIGLLIQGTSFSEGLMKDILDLYPEEEVYWMNRADYVTDRNYNRTVIDTWDAFDVGKYLSRVDAVLIETTEPELPCYSQGFVDYLINYLDTYVPENYKPNYVEYMDGSEDAAWNSDSLYGVYGREGGFAWVKRNCQISLESEKITEGGLELDFSVPQETFRDGEVDAVEVFVNGEQVYSEIFATGWDGTIRVPAEEISGDDHVYHIQIISSKAFNPKEAGVGEDDRDLALAVRYVGGPR